MPRLISGGTVVSCHKASLAFAASINIIFHTIVYFDRMFIVDLVPYQSRNVNRTESDSQV